MSLTAKIKRKALSLGFAQIGILPAGPSFTINFYEKWLARGFGGEMAYLHRHAEKKRDVRRLLPNARSVIVLTWNYNRHLPPENQSGVLYGKISRYAWGGDYHQMIGGKMEALGGFIEKEIRQPLDSLQCVDSSPIMEREFAARAGLGWVGKNGNIINWELGSWLFLAELLVDIPLEYDQPFTLHSSADNTAKTPPVNNKDASFSSHLPGFRESCGSCTACIQACPTQAIIANKTIDARRCISYLTIENKGAIPLEFRSALGDWIFGCDICQDVCPWNRRPVKPELADSDHLEINPRPFLPQLLGLNDEDFKKQYQGTALNRAKRKGLLRNAAIALGNYIDVRNKEGNKTGDNYPEGQIALGKALLDQEPLIRGAAAWALGNIGNKRAREKLGQAVRNETDPTVTNELKMALGK